MPMLSVKLSHHSLISDSDSALTIYLCIRIIFVTV